MRSGAATLPWLTPAWMQWQAVLRLGGAPQAMMLVGPEGLGKTELALEMAQGLLCEQPIEARACGQCPACLRMQAGSHPDLIQLHPLDQAQHIVVDQLRQLISRLSLRPQYGRGRIVLIMPAESMNLQAANCLLKTLEEPEDDTSFLLVSSHPQRIPMTVTSRCQRITVSMPSRKVSGEWLISQGVALENVPAQLAVANDAPWRAHTVDKTALTHREAVIRQGIHLLQHKADPLQVAEAWSKEESTPLVILKSIIMDMIRLKIFEGASISNEDMRPDLLRCMNVLHLDALLALMDAFPDWLRSQMGQANRQLLMEDCALTFYRSSMEKNNVD